MLNAKLLLPGRDGEVANRCGNEDRSSFFPTKRATEHDEGDGGEQEDGADGEKTQEIGVGRLCRGNASVGSRYRERSSTETQIYCVCVELLDRFHIESDLL